MIKNTHSVLIAAPVNKVFAFAADFENDARWRDEVERMRYTSHPPVGVGSEAVENSRILGRSLETTTVITDFEPNRRVVARSISGPVPIVSSRDFEAVQGGTRFTYTLEGDVSGVLLFRLIQPILASWYRRRLEGYLRTLKQTLESKPAPTPG